MHSHSTKGHHDDTIVTANWLSGDGGTALAELYKEIQGEGAVSGEQWALIVNALGHVFHSVA